MSLLRCSNLGHDFHKLENTACSGIPNADNVMVFYHVMTQHGMI